MILNEMTLLFVEDDGNSRDLIGALLEKHVKDIFLAADGEEGWELYRERSPDIILADIHMPRMNGLEFAGKIREKDRMRPILFLSAHSDSDTLFKAANLCIDGFIVKPVLDIDDLLSKLRESARRISKIRERNLVQKQKIDRLENIAYYDHLTGARNRFYFEECLSRAVHNSRSDGERFALVYFDLDNLKQTNDTYGHHAGDRLLVTFVSRVFPLLGGRALSRIGGDEFALIIENIQRDEEVVSLIDRIVKSTTKPIEYEDGFLEFSCSVGISWYPDEAESAEELIRNADMKMYRAKKEGKRNGIIWR